MKRFLVFEVRENEIHVHGCVWARSKACAGFNFAEYEDPNADIRVMEVNDKSMAGSWMSKPWGGGELAIEQASVPVTLGRRASQSSSIMIVEKGSIPAKKSKRS
jgi:hypothetical protein